MSRLNGTVCVIDDDGAVRCTLDGLIRTIGFRGKFFASAREFLNSRRVETPACIILDIRLPGMSGLQLQRQLAEAHSTNPIIFVTGQSDIAVSVTAMKAGAFDFLTKPVVVEELVDRILAAIELDHRRRQQQADVATLKEHFQSLRPREREVLKHVVSGLVNKQVAAEMGVSEATVKAHRGRLMRKMHADSIADLVRMGGKLGIYQELG